MTSPRTTNLSLVDTDPAELAVDAIVIGVHSQPGEQGATSGLAGTLLLASGAESIAAAFDGKLTRRWRCSARPVGRARSSSWPRWAP